ncbi:MAG: DUF927 domain-containing protein [Geobacteraceae bacterium]|nr:DUF927 domain-containing protein [Geobacteraceae bacterium]
MISDFYNSIFPPIGLRALAVFKDGLKKAPTHSFYDNNEDLIEAAGAYNSTGKNVYHGCAVYKTSDNRKGENVLACKSLWLDLDVGPTKPYATQREAVTDYEAFRVSLGLPKSHIVSSGNGIHQYHAFTKPISPDNWDRVAALYAACMDHYGVKHDTSRTQDKASILRIPGTSNYKADPAKAVTLKRLGEEVPAGEFYKKLKDYADANGVLVGSTAPKGKPLKENKMMNRDFPPSHGDKIGSVCAVIAEVDISGGDVPYEIWWRALGIAKHTTEPDVVAAHWTRNRSASGRDKSDWKGLMDAWATGPTTCNDFNKHSDKCASCPMFGKLSTPLHLGVDEQPPIVVDDTEDADESTDEEAVEASLVMQGPWEFKAPWVVRARHTATKTGWNNGEMYMGVRQKGNTGYKQVPFCNRYWQVMRRIRDTDGIWKLEIGYELYPGTPYKKFLMESSTLAARDTFCKEFAAREIHFYGDAGAAFKGMELARWDQKINTRYRAETTVYPTMGWASENNSLRGALTGEFILGDTVFRAKAPTQQVILGDTVDVSLRSDFKTAGTTKEWVELIDFIYNRPGAEAYQFVISAMFGAPLVRLMPGEGEWHGIPVVLGGDSGAAKTSTALAALSIYAPPQLLRFSAQGDKNGQGDTINALSLKIGSLRNVPFLMDELTGADADKISNIAYMVSNGKSKDRMGPNGRMIPNPYRWDVLSIATSNDSLHDVLDGVRSANTKEASQIRLFQIDLKRSDLGRVFHNVSRNMIEHTLLEKQYGKVGHEWLQFIVNNRIAIQDMLGVEREKYMVNPTDTSEIRFYKDLIITTKVAATLAKRKGFISWDVAPMIKWAESRLMTLRDSVATKDWEGRISDFIGSLHGRIIVTHHMKMGPGKRATSEIPMEALSTSVGPEARKAITDRRFVVTVAALKNWCRNNRLLPKNLLEEMIARGYMVGVAGTTVTPKLINIGSGTTVIKSQAPCYELDYDKVTEFDADSAPVDMSNVVQLQPVTEVVTVAPQEPESSSGAV